MLAYATNNHILTAAIPSRAPAHAWSAFQDERKRRSSAKPCGSVVGNSRPINDRFGS
jgi:hypothetical protein